MKAAFLIACAGLVAVEPAKADSCRRSGSQPDPAVQLERCRPDERLEPYDPDRVRAGRSPGFIDLGNGIEIRVGGRVQLDYDRRR